MNTCINNKICNIMSLDRDPCGRWILRLYSWWISHLITNHTPSSQSTATHPLYPWMGNTPALSTCHTPVHPASEAHRNNLFLLVNLVHDGLVPELSEYAQHVGGISVCCVSSCPQSVADGIYPVVDVDLDDSLLANIWELSEGDSWSSLAWNDYCKAPS